MNTEQIFKKVGDILVVDDRLENAALLFNILTENGYEVRQVINGKQALNAAYYDPPDIILLDIMMPDMDGYEVCRQLKKNEKTAQIPIIFLSALDGEIDKVKAFELGGVDYITKPFHVKEVLARVEHQLIIQRQRRIIAAQNTQLTEQNQSLTDLNSKLAESNHELEQFAYIVSHDLQSPLQTTMGFARLLGKKYESILDEKATHYIDRIVEGSNRMNHLIKDLLEYSRIQTRAKSFEAIDLNSVFQEVLFSLEWSIKKTEAEITCQQPLPTVMGDRTQLQQLLQNLINNAIKFQQPDRKPTINISVEPLTTLPQTRNNLTENYCENSANIPLERTGLIQTIERPSDKDQGNEWRFSIEDNGIGIPVKEFEHIFQIFQRLHTDREYPGTGIGLTICKKIVERHGGKIWLNSEVGVGTTFYFTLPMLPE
jgi:light-regulated signal transduction histidine kinase (bacteriophytochrome)